MKIAYSIEPDKTLDSKPFGLEHAMVELLILHSFYHGASRLEYRTIDGVFRVAQIVAEAAHEYPQPPACVRQQTLEHLRTIFSFVEGNGEYARTLAMGEVQALARCKISADNQNAWVILLEHVEPSADLLASMQRFFRKAAARQGLVALLKYYFESLVSSSVFVLSGR
jgi:hypothetical protein